MVQLNFRYALPEDLEKIVTTYNSTIPGREVTADLEPVTVQSRQDWFSAHSPGHRPIWIVTCDSRYAGWLSFSSFYGRPAYENTVEISIYLEPIYKGKGIGHACLRFAMEEAATRKLTNLLGFIFGHNLSSIRLFEKNGFEKWGHLPGVANMDGTLRDLIIYGFKLG